MKKSIFIIAAIIILIPFSILMIDYSRPIQEPFKVGDYILFSTYLDEPILWRVIDRDESGDPLLLSEYIITLKAFDASGDKYTDSRRQKYGSSYWIDSNIRQWLNSADKKIKWKMNEPSAENLWCGFNPYNEESGFLSDDNFTGAERRAIKSVTRRLTLSEYDRDKAIGGSEYHRYDRNIDSLYNYDKVYYQMTTDKVFFLSLGELKTLFFDRGWEYRTRPTEKAVEQSQYEIPQKRIDKYWEYWLMDPQGDYSCHPRLVLADLDVEHAGAYMVEGIRPALYLQLSKIETVSGSGLLEDPCVVKGRSFFSVLR